MTFARPEALLLVPVVLALLAAAWWWQRRRPAQGGLPHPDLDVFDHVAVAPRNRRHLPLALALLGLLAVTLGVARPEAERSVPRDRATVMLAIDVSGSMAAADVEPTRLRAAQEAAIRFADRMPRTFQVGLVAFSTNASVIVPPTTDREQLVRGIEGLVAVGDTAIGEALVASLNAIKESQGDAGITNSARILLLSDGANRTGRPVSAAIPELVAAKVPVYAIALGTPDGSLGPGRPVPPSPEAMREIADRTGGQSFESQDADSVSQVYEDLGEFIGSVRERHEVTDWAVGLAMALFAAAALAWWRWGVRLG